MRLLLQGLRVGKSSVGRGDGYFYGREELLELAVYEDPVGSGIMRACGFTHPENRMPPPG